MSLGAARAGIARAWAFLRTLSGDSAYDAHLAHARDRGVAPLSPRDFYLDRLRRTYSRPNRCC